MIEALVRTSTRRVSIAIRRRVKPWLFAHELFRGPASVGAVCPSSARLAQRMASHVSPDGEGLVVELGAGTGVVTQALLDRGIAPERLAVIERSPAFVRHLRARFPDLAVILGSATELADLLEHAGPIDAIVSSLPLRSLPADDVTAIVGQWRHLLATDGVAVQYTYDLRDCGRLATHGFAVRANEIVWGNLPPARVFAFERRPRTDGAAGQRTARRKRTVDTAIATAACTGSTTGIPSASSRGRR
ncbi:class I SAM-dependent methyltransferase [Shumkonia mesophila]|uniref:class I SAM-dependent methyltransferase n=1 Tax=Shumkonia mesophila TaxID=2838854 RepID=UPI00293426EC|nr:methyltransferase domain-containing protein [Shumkonia mesophila]